MFSCWNASQRATCHNSATSSAFAKLGRGDDAKALFDILNPIRHGDTAQKMGRYQVESYVAWADVYSVDPHVGRGGWTWYTGSGGWLYRAGLEAVLGFRRQGDRLLIEPRIPASWPDYAITYRHRGSDGSDTRYEIAVENPYGVENGVTPHGSRWSNPG